MEPITLTPHQQAAVDWLVAKLVAGEKLIALRGLAGTGKTSVIPALQAALKAHNLPTTIGAPTHRAAMILRKKGLAAETVHSAALVPYFTADYRRACAWLGEEVPVRTGTPQAVPHADVDGLPWLIYEAVKPDLERGMALKRQRRYTARRRLASLGISGKDHFSGFGPKAGEGVLIVDEASMVGEALLASCQEAYQQLVLVGDPGQLPPVKDVAMLTQVEGVDLTEIHRQAKESPIIQLAMQARAGEAFWTGLDHDPLSIGKPVRAVEEVSARRLLTCPLLVGHNDTRIVTTHAIRQALGYAKGTLVPGEPLVCRSTSQEDRVLGFFNNGLYTITEVSPNDSRLITVKDALGDTQAIRVHLEEVDSDCIDPRAIPFRFGYALTVHTAQGGEWPRVYISLPEVTRKVRNARRYGEPKELAQWTYTAITRAKTTLRFLTQHIFTPPKERMSMATPHRTSETSASQEAGTAAQPTLLRPTPTAEERLAAAPDRAAEAAIFGADDITDPTVPLPLQEALAATTLPQEATQADAATSGTAGPPALPLSLPERFGAHEAIFQAALAHLMHKFDEAVGASAKDLTKGADEVYSFVHHQLQIQREKAQQAETYLDTLTTKAVTQGIQLRHDPYTVTVQSLSPQGFPVTLHLAKQDKGALVDELEKLVQWLAQHGYKPVGAGL